jgi:integrase
MVSGSSRYEPRGLRIDSTWARKNVLASATKLAGAPWACFHTFQHTCASMLFERDGNQVVQMLRGHSDPGFTLRT